MDTASDPFATLRAYLDRVERIAQNTVESIPPDLRDDRVCSAIRVQFAREAVRHMADLLK